MDTEKQIIETFADEMLKKIELRHDRYVPFAWSRMDRKRLISLMKQEIKEFEEATNKTDMRDEALDIANYAMFLWYILHK